ncbi:hypothetical protein H920_02298 [Fukomys damarensis]|uniref:Uncharacterized protein n=1 Tax=Fukomys damarensis TaxID=885580 RepID=A0A091E194_FUKDA|nr:hypothetical protein H920_02298 [Fukomys damarensis]
MDGDPDRNAGAALSGQCLVAAEDTEAVFAQLSPCRVGAVRQLRSLKETCQSHRTPRGRGGTRPLPSPGALRGAVLPAMVTLAAWRRGCFRDPEGCCPRCEEQHTAQGRGRSAGSAGCRRQALIPEPSRDLGLAGGDGCKGC